MMLSHRLAGIAFLALALALPPLHSASAHGVEDAPAAATERDLPAPSAVETLTGTVHELIVDDATRGTSHRYVDLRLDDGTLVPLLGDDSASLAAGERAEVSGARNGRRFEVRAARRLAQAPAKVLKSGTEVEGDFGVLHADDFAAGSSSFVYEVRQASGRVNRLHFGSVPTVIAPGARIRVQGRVEADGESIAPDQITILAPPTLGTKEGATTKAATANDVLVILANFNNTAVPGYTPSQAQQVMTTNADSVGNFFRETSYGQQLMNVTVTPSWVTMNLAQPATCSSSDWTKIASAAEAAAKALGGAYDPALYDFVVYLFPGVSACGWNGLAYISSPRKAWINGTGSFKTGTVAHEMGHNFGLLHAGSVRCSGAIIGGACSVAEYGDPFDTMGNQRAMHYNAMQKSKLNWIPATSVKTHGSGAATYTLTPLEVAGGDTYAVKIPTPSPDRTYWVEFRQPIGFDAPLGAFPSNGAEVRVSAPFETYCSGCDVYSNDTEMLDMTPATSAFTDGTLTIGQTFVDPQYGIGISVVSASAGALTVQVASGGATTSPTATATSLTATPNPSLTGAMVTFTATVSGSAPTGTVGFTDNGTPLSGCSAVPLAGGGNAPTAICATNALPTGNHAIVATYGGDAANQSSTSATWNQVVSAPINGTDVALAANGGAASASSVWGPSFAPSSVIDNERSGAGWGNYAGWADGTSGAFPDWVQINFAGSRSIDHVVVYSVQDDFLNPVDPTDTMTGTQFVLTSFQVQGWTGSGWVTLGSVSGNNLIKRTVSFPAYATDRIRIVVNGTQDGVWSRITEVEAWTSTVVRTNYALASNGSSVTASSTWGPSFPGWTVVDNKRSGASWGNYAGWADGTSATFPDWLQVNFNGSKVIDRVVVYSVQDNYLSPVEPTDSMTGTRFVVSAFDVQAWNGSGWTTVASVGGNNLVKRTVSFTPYVTTAMKIVIKGTQDGVWSRLTEVEAWGQ